MENFLLTKVSSLAINQEKRLGSLSILYVIVEVGLCLFFFTYVVSFETLNACFCIK